MATNDHRMPVPHFLGIGAQKSATTWLYTCLNNHPEIYVPLKEMHYFNRRSQLICATDAERSFVARLDQLLKFDGALGKHFQTTLENALTMPRHRLRLLLNFHLGTQDDEWYRSLFDDGRGKCCGEITPAYSVLTAEDVQSVHQFNPNCKIIFLMRNPVDREWSSYKFWYSWGQKSNWTGSLQQFKEHVNRTEVQLRSNYLRTIRNWQGVFGADQMFLGFFEDVKTKPRELLRDIASFLEVENDWTVDDSKLAEKTGQTPDRSMPREIRRFLYDRHLQQIEQLADQLGGHAASWLREAKANLSDNIPLDTSRAA